MSNHKQTQKKKIDTNMTSCIVHHIYMMNNTFFRLDILQKKKKNVSFIIEVIFL